jgi:hypothetical protein
MAWAEPLPTAGLTCARPASYSYRVLDSRKPTCACRRCGPSGKSSRKASRQLPAEARTGADAERTCGPAAGRVRRLSRHTRSRLRYTPHPLQVRSHACRNASQRSRVRTMICCTRSMTS